MSKKLPTNTEKVEESGIEESISNLDLLSINLPSNLARLRFVIQPGVLIEVKQVKQIHKDGRLDLEVAEHSTPAPVGMKNVISKTSYQTFFPKVRRDDLGKDAGVYKVVGG